jgi:uncharacterized membrane protein
MCKIILEFIYWQKNGETIITLLTFLLFMLLNTKLNKKAKKGVPFFGPPFIILFHVHIFLAT